MGRNDRKGSLKSGGDQSQDAITQSSNDILQFYEPIEKN